MNEWLSTQWLWVPAQTALRRQLKSPAQAVPFVSLRRGTPSAAERVQQN